MVSDLSTAAASNMENRQERKKYSIRPSIDTYFHTKNKKGIELCILLRSLALTSLGLQGCGRCYRAPARRGAFDSPQ